MMEHIARPVLVHLLFKGSQAQGLLGCVIFFPQLAHVVNQGLEGGRSQGV